VIVRDSFGSIDNLYTHSRDITGLATGFTDFDRMTSGLQKGELIIIAARPSMGKTALAINIAENAAVRYGSIVAIFSLEMSKESLLRRMLASQASVDQQKIQKGFFGRDEQEKLRAALSFWWSRASSLTIQPPQPSPKCAQGPAASSRMPAASTSS